MGGGMYFCPTGTAELYIDQGAGTLGDHGIECFARGLQYPFKDSLEENTERADADDLQTTQCHNG